MFIKRAAVLLFTIITISIVCTTNKSRVTTKSNGIELKVMTWNIWGRLNLDPRYSLDGKTARERVIEILQESEADIITMTETYGSAADIAAAMDYNYYTPASDANLTIFSRYPIVAAGNIRDLSPFSFIRATIELPNKKKIQVYNIWLTSEGRHIVDIKNDTISDGDFDRGDEARYHHLLELLSHEQFKTDLENMEDVPVIVAGDFNCVSHLDYTPTSKKNNLNYRRVLENKTSKAMMEAGFVDSYRAVHPNITTATLGYTWTTVGQGFMYQSDHGFVPVDRNPEPEYRDPCARIDYIYSAGSDIISTDSKTIIHHSSNSSRSFPEVPSDHGAVLSTFRIRD